MVEKNVFQQFHYWRDGHLTPLKTIHTDLIDIIWDGFNNKFDEILAMYWLPRRRGDLQFVIHERYCRKLRFYL